MIEKARNILRETFGYEEFRPLQADIIQNVLQKRDSLVIMPTGGGKSICYQIPSMIFDGLTIVISPLISLMKDQVEQLEEFGVPALYLNSSLSPEEYRQNIERLRRGEAKLLYLADSSAGGKNNRQPFNVYQAIQDTTAAERGRFLFDRSGQAVFWNRHFLIQQSRPSGLPEANTDQNASVFDSHVVDMDYEYAALDEFINDVRVTCHPRTLSANNNVLLHELVYDHNNPEPGIVVPPGEEKVINISFKDAETNRVGALHTHMAYIRWSGGVAVDWQTEDGESGTNFLTVPPGTLELEATASGAKLRIRAGSTYAHLLAYEVRGQAIYDNGPIEAVAENQYSITHYGRRSRRMDIAALDQPGFARNIADFEIHQRSTPRGAIRQITLRSHTNDEDGRHMEQLHHTPGTTIEVHEAQTDHQGTYVIIGEAHRLSDGGALLETTWYLEPLTSENWARVEESASIPGFGTEPVSMIRTTLSDGQKEPLYYIAY